MTWCLNDLARKLTLEITVPEWAPRVGPGAGMVRGVLGALWPVGSWGTCMGQEMAGTPDWVALLPSQ